MREIITQKKPSINHGAPPAACRLFLNRVPPVASGFAPDPPAASAANGRARSAG